MIKYRYGFWMREKGKGPATGIFEPNDENTKMTLQVEQYSVGLTKEQVRELIDYLEGWLDE